MTLAPDLIEIGVPDLTDAQRFYAAFLSTPVPADGGAIDVHGAGRLALRQDADAGPEQPFSGVVLNLIVAQPAEVTALTAAAERAGARVLKPAKKGFFGGFTAVVRAPDGAVWKIAAPQRKDTAPAGEPPRPTELVAILGVDEPRAAKSFYESVGLSTERDYGNKFIDFVLSPGSWRLGLMQPNALAKDAGVEVTASTGAPIVLVTELETREQADRAVGEATAAGATVDDPQPGSARLIVAPDGHRWRLAHS